MEIFRENLKKEVNQIGTKIFARKMGYSENGLGRLLRGERKITENHLIAIEQILGKPICNLFQSEEEILKQKRERERMKDYQEMITLMEMIPAIRQIIMGKKAELEKTFADEIRSAEKKSNLHLNSR